MKVEVESDKCIASGGCVLACPEVFDQDDDGIVILKDANPPDELYDNVAEAVEACPSSVISVS
jgi:ferredoxin